MDFPKGCVLVYLPFFAETQQGSFLILCNNVGTGVPGSSVIMVVNTATY